MYPIMQTGQKSELLILFTTDAVVFFGLVFKAHQAQTADCKLLIRSMAHRFNLHEA